MRKIIFALVILLLMGSLNCMRDAQVASHNLAVAAEEFQLNRRIVFFNGITDQYLLTIEGRCSLDHQRGQLEVTCKHGEGLYKKHHLGLSDNVSYFSEQLDVANADVYHYRVVFRPSVIVPAVELDY